MKKLIHSLYISFFALILITSCTGTGSKLGLDEPKSDYAIAIASRNQPGGVFPESDYAPRSLATKAIKKAIRVVINNIPKAKKVIKKVAGPEVAESFVAYFDQVATAIEPLLAYSELTAEIVYKQVIGGMIRLGVSRAVAEPIALAIREGLDWFILP